MGVHRQNHHVFYPVLPCQCDPVTPMGFRVSPWVISSTVSLVYRPHAVTHVPVKWLYKAKCDSAGNIDQFKARLVARGLNQQEGIYDNMRQEGFCPCIIIAFHDMP